MSSSVDLIAGGRYQVERALGHGGMASVYLARDRELDRLVALKVLAEHLADDAAFRERFIREARLAARLSHPHVVQLYDAGEQDGRLYIVMECVPGETLAEMLARRSKLSVREAIEIARQAAVGLQHVHAAGLVHRDLKPQNVLVRDDGVVKIADFGVARAAEGSRMTQVGTVLGTAAYLAPEQALGKDVGPAADVYSLGAVLYEALTGRPPHEFSSLAELAEKQRSGSVVPVRDLEPGVPEALEALVMRCLARDPRFRPTSAGALAAALAGETDEADERPTLVAATKALPARITQSVPGRGAWIWIAAAAVLGLVALALGLANIGGGSSPRHAQRTTPVVAPVPHGATAADEARNLAAWLRSHSR